MTSINRISVLIFRIFLFLGIIGIITACSRQKNTWLNRNFHAMTSYYNILYHGNAALEKGITQMEENYKDDFLHILPIEQMGPTSQSTALKTGDSLPIKENFNRAEEKATKAIQKHSMTIKGEEYNPQMGKAFLLLGKSRYYDQRYFPALEAFNYILRHYDTQELLNTTQIWKEKTYLRLGNNEERVITNLKTILNGNPKLYITISRISKALEQAYLSKKAFDMGVNLLQIYFDRQKVSQMARKSLTKENITQASSMLAQAYLNIGEKEKALQPLQLAINMTGDKNKMSRFLFIKAQILEALDKPERAQTSYEAVIALNRRSPRPYLIHAYIRKANLSIRNNHDRQAQLTLLKDLLKDRENRPYRDILNYQVGNYFEAVDSVKTGFQYYKKALSSNSPPDKGLRYRIYKALADYYFDKKHYGTATAYYDSTLVNLPPISQEYEAIRKKQLHLKSLSENKPSGNSRWKGDGPEKTYNKLYKKYKSGHYKEVLREIDTSRTRFSGYKIAPKLDLLRAFVKGRLFGVDVYQEELSRLALNYPQTDAGKKAKALIANALPHLKAKTFTTKGNRGFKLICPFSYPDRTKAEQTREKVEKSLKNLGLTKLSVSRDIFSAEKIFIVISGLKSLDHAGNLVKRLKKEKAFPSDHDQFVISTENYETLLIHKNLDNYRREFDLYP